MDINTNQYVDPRYIIHVTSNDPQPRDRTAKEYICTQATERHATVKVPEFPAAHPGKSGRSRPPTRESWGSLYDGLLHNFSPPLHSSRSDSISSWATLLYMLPFETLPFCMLRMPFMLRAMWRSTGLRQWRLLFCLLRLWRIRMMTMTATTRRVTMRAESVPTMIPIMSFSVVASFVWTDRSSTCCCESESMTENIPYTVNSNYIDIDLSLANETCWNLNLNTLSQCERFFYII